MTDHLRKILDIIDTVEARCLAADGPVTPTLQAISDDEVLRLDRYARGTPAQAVMDRARTPPPGKWPKDMCVKAGLYLTEEDLRVMYRAAGGKA